MEVRNNWNDAGARRWRCWTKDSLPWKWPSGWAVLDAVSIVGERRSASRGPGRWRRCRIPDAPAFSPTTRSSICAIDWSRGARSQGFDTDLWTCPRVKALIEREYGVSYHVDHIVRLLRSLGFTPQKPKRRAIERDEEAIARWIRKGLAADQKKARRRQAHLVFADESGFLMSPLVRRTWAAAGCTPVLHQRTRSYRHVSAVGAITISPRRKRLGLFLQLHPDASIRQQQAIQFLKGLLRHLRGHVVLVWDRLSVHRGRLVQKFINGNHRLDVESLPPYAPELNAIEYLWGWMKTNPLANRCPSDLDELTRDVQRSTEGVMNNQQLLRGFVHASGLSIQLA